ncbi:MAG: hypothetical protein MI739_06885 [Bacteroidales bacterium]|nr:hypothetical protein [Bacteroidales bacterium]
MLKRISILLLLSILAISCKKESTDDFMTNTDILGISYGQLYSTSNGFSSIGIKITKDTLSFSVDSVVTKTTIIKSDILADLKNKVNLIVFRNLEEVIGCPDCDGSGAEILGIVTTSFSHEIKFEKGNEPEDLTNLVNDLRSRMMIYGN